MQAWALLVFAASCAPTHHGAPGAASELDLVVRDVCDRKIVLLGEDAHHGSGTTFAFKTRLVKRLVDECRFDGFVIEAGAYDFIDLEARRSVDHAALAAAIGGLWANREVAELIPFLAQRAERGALFLGGIDDQIGRGTYAQQRMSGELAAFLADDRRGACLVTLERHMRWEYDDAHPYGADAVKAILGCWRDVGAALAGRSGPRVAGYRQMVAALERTFERELAQDHDARDRSMFVGFEQWLAGHPQVIKVIVWTATVHAARKRVGEGVPFGAHVAAKYGTAAFVLGFSAQAGRISRAGRGPVDLEPAGAAALEGRVATNHYLSRKQLAAFGAIAARAIDYERWMVASWDTLLDGLVVFREEVAPTPLTL
jgi:erythromycin esterase-like protein